jgi:hypothetical protein
VVVGMQVSFARARIEENDDLPRASRITSSIMFLGELLLPEIVGDM